VAVDESSISRRRFALGAAGLLTSSVLVDGCARHVDSPEARRGTLLARPRSGVTTLESGLRRLGVGSARDAVLRLPPSVGSQPMPLLVLLHGAGGDGEHFLRRLLPMASAARVALLAPDSRNSTWDAVLPVYRTLIDAIDPEPHLMGFGPDVVFLDQVLEQVFQVVAVDRARIAIGGFSDGASYALSLGLLNGDLFSRIIAFSPGLIAGGPPEDRRERPLVFVSHGRADRTLPIDRSSRRIVSTLRKRGYEVTYREFDGGHEIPEAIVREAFGWMPTA
jgi:phospholipase/carboxylesterase